MNPQSLFIPLGLCVVAAPLALCAILGLPTLLGRPLGEKAVTRCSQLAITTGLIAATAILVLMLATGERHVPVELADWVTIPGYHLVLKIVFDRLSVPFAILSFLLCGVIGAFASAYLHREPGFNRFFVLYAVFLGGMILATLAGTIETLFAGWEFVGLSSALLVAFFQERPAPVRNGLHVWTVYRVADAAFLLAAVVLHHLTGEGDFDALRGSGAWPAGRASLTGHQALLVGLLLVVAAAGKSALIPFSGWLPRAMEGPTPSSAVFYGALSVHLGAFLLLRISPILQLSPWLAAVVITLGLATAVLASLVARVQSDIKTALAFGSLTQIGIIVAEIGLGLRYLALMHIIGHACLRTLQFLRAPTLLHDYHALENAIGSLDPHAKHPQAAVTTSPAALRLYRFALERGYLDAVLTSCVVEPFQRFFLRCDAVERRWTDWLSGEPSRISDRVPPTAGQLDDLA